MNRFSSSLLCAALPAALVLGTPAKAECLGDGCYDGLGTVLFGLAAGAIAVLVAVIWSVIVVWRRKGGRKAAVFAVGVCVAAYLFLTAWSFYWL